MEFGGIFSTHTHILSNIDTIPFFSTLDLFQTALHTLLPSQDVYFLPEFTLPQRYLNYAASRPVVTQARSEEEEEKGLLRSRSSFDISCYEGASPGLLHCCL
jgi:hypothetical protein